MALDQSALLELLEALKDTGVDDVVRRALEAVFQALIEAEAAARIGAAPHQRTPERVTWRNGYRDRALTTAAGDLELRIPKLRSCAARNSIERLTSAIASRLDAVMVGWPGAAQDRLSADVPGTRRSCLGVPRRPSEGC